MAIPKLIRKARGELNQTEFAAILGKTQGEISKYERGVSQAPNTVIEECMNMLAMHTKEISANDLAHKIIEGISDDKHSSLRNAISEIVDAAAPHKRTKMKSDAFTGVEGNSISD